MDNLTEKQWILCAHLGTFIGYLIPFGNIIAPLLVYSMKKDSLLVREHSRNSLNFQISISLYIFISAILIIIVVGIGLIVILLLLQFVLVIVATLKADKDEVYRYPLTIQFVKD